MFFFCLCNSSCLVSVLIPCGNTRTHNTASLYGALKGFNPVSQTVYINSSTAHLKMLRTFPPVIMGLWASLLRADPIFYLFFWSCPSHFFLTRAQNVDIFFHMSNFYICFFWRLHSWESPSGPCAPKLCLTSSIPKCVRRVSRTITSIPLFPPGLWGEGMFQEYLRTGPESHAVPELVAQAQFADSCVPLQ